MISNLQMAKRAGTSKFGISNTPHEITHPCRSLAHYVQRGYYYVRCILITMRSVCNNTKFGVANTP